MAYDAIPEKVPTDDFEAFDATRHSKRQTKLILRLSTANLVLLVCQIILLGTHLASNLRPSTSRLYTEKTYGFDTKYMTLNHDYDWLWKERAVQDAGTIAVRRDATGNVTEYGTISMFHQLHCVASLRHALQKAYEGEPVAFNEREDPHWPHCLHYLHQAIVCNADGQIEKQETWNFSIPFISGAEDVRNCGNAKKLYDLFESEAP